MANRPEISNVTFTPNPVNTKASVKISVQVEDKAITFKSEVIYTAEIYAGQQIGVI